MIYVFLRVTAFFLATNIIFTNGTPKLFKICCILSFIFSNISSKLTCFSAITLPSPSAVSVFTPSFNSAIYSLL